MAYTGSVELISGIKQKNNGTFPLVDATAVRVEDDRDLKTELNGLVKKTDIVNDLVKVSETPPTSSEINKFWVHSAETEVQIPTYDEVSGLKSAIDGINNTLTEGNDSSDYWQINSWYTVDGTHVGNNKRIRTKAGVITPAGLDYIVTSDSGVVFYVVFYTASGTYVPRSSYPFVSYADIKAIAPEGAEVFRLVAKTDPESTLTNIVSATGAKVHISHGVIGAIDNRLNALETVEDELVEFAPITGFATANGVLKNDGTIQSSSTLVIKKYPYSGGNVYLDGTASYDLAKGFCYVWFVANEAMMENGYISVSSKPQTFDMQKLDVPAGTEEIWVGHSALALYETSAIDRYARGKIVDIENRGVGGNQWSGKSWYAYGTSLTTEDHGHYANLVASMSGMNLTNRGYGGGGMVSNPKIYERLKDMSDGKLNADLITIECGANDGAAPIGDPASMDTTTICGALNDAIKYMFDNGIKAQVVLMCSYPSRYQQSDSSVKFDVTSVRAGGGTWADLCDAIRKVAMGNGLYYISFNGVGMGKARGNGTYGDLFVTDNIHPTLLGGYNVALGVWYQLRNIPVFYSEMPT